jgi:hypothetical protein
MRLGLIIIGDFEERFEASLSYWSVKDYQRHWWQALERIKAGEIKSSLITNMYDPQTANFILWWPLYRDGQDVFVQNHVVPMDEINGTFDPVNPYVHVRDRETVNEDGKRISEWKTTVAEIEDYLNTLPQD